MRIAVVLALLVMFAGCGSGDGDGATPESRPDSGSPPSSTTPGGVGSGIVFETAAKGAQGPTTAAQVVARSPAEFESAWHSSGGDDPPGLGAVDFGTEMVLAVFQGQQPTAGYDVEVRSVSGVFEVRYWSTTPAEGCITAQVLTAPFHVVVVPRTDMEVTFIEEPHSNPC